MIIEMPVLDNAIPACGAAFTPLLFALTFGEPVMRVVAARSAGSPADRVPFLIELSLDWLAQDPGPSGAVLQGILFGRTAPEHAVRCHLETPALVIGHPRDPVHPFSDADMLAAELPERDAARRQLDPRAANPAQAPDRPDRRVRDECGADEVGLRRAAAQTRGSASARAARAARAGDPLACADRLVTRTLPQADADGAGGERRSGVEHAAGASGDSSGYLRVTVPRLGGPGRLDDVAAGRLQPLVQLELPEVAGERDPGVELADVRARSPRRAPFARSAPGTCGRAAPRHRRRERPAETRVDVGDPETDIAVAEHLDRARPAHAQRLDHPPPKLDQLVVGDHRPLDRLASARLDHRPRDRVQASALRGPTGSRSRTRDRPSTAGPSSARARRRRRTRPPLRRPRDGSSGLPSPSAA